MRCCTTLEHSLPFAYAAAGCWCILQDAAASAALPVVGFCFSFAVEQQALNSGKLMGWTKGFDVDGVVGKDVVALLSGAVLAGFGVAWRCGVLQLASLLLLGP